MVNNNFPIEKHEIDVDGIEVSGQDGLADPEVNEEPYFVKEEDDDLSHIEAVTQLLAT